MNQDILEQLKSLKAITPDADFAARTRRLILAFPVTEKRWPAFFNFSWTKVAFGTLAIVAVIVVTVILPGLPKTVPIASAEALSNEFNNLSVNIELRQITYNQNVNQTIASALAEITNNKLNHLNPAILQSESSSVDPTMSPVSNPQIDALLNQVTK
jgi:hypothetical protein